jgi:chemotaxis protein MotB
VLKDKDALDASVEDMSLAMAELSRRQQEADRRIAEFRALLRRFGDLIDAGKLKVKIIDGRMIVEMATDVLFSSGSAKLSKEGQGAVVEVTGILASIPTRKFQIEGHTDNVPIRSSKFPSNWHLAAARALSVVDTMLEAGMPSERVSAASFGETRPSTENESRDGRQANRRIEIVILPDLSLLPGFEELQRMGN